MSCTVGIRLFPEILLVPCLVKLQSFRGAVQWFIEVVCFTDHMAPISTIRNDEKVYMELHYVASGVAGIIVNVDSQSSSRHPTRFSLWICFRGLLYA